MVDGVLIVQQGSLDIRQSANLSVSGNLTLIDSQILIVPDLEPISVQSCVNFENSTLSVNFTSADAALLGNSQFEITVCPHIPL